MSLRLRLLLTLLALAGVGLLIVDAVSYGSLRSHLLDRVDQQVEAARGPATIALLRRGTPGVVRGGGESGAPLPPPQSGEAVVPPPGAGPSGAQLPPGTYGVLRNANGRNVRHISFSYGESLPAPALPASVPVSGFGDSVQTFTAGARSGGTDFRAAAFRLPGTSFTAIVAVPLNDLHDTLDHVALIGAIVTASVLLGLGLLAWWMIRLELRPLEEMGETAGRIAGGDLSQRVEQTNPRTEVGRLGTSLNSMLGQIEEAFDQRAASERRMRRFLADASHELRTPLTSIRGYAELFRMGAVRDTDELDRAMGRIEQESARMGGMVNDLLRLARLDEIREPVREHVDLSDLVSAACADARATAPDRVISYTPPGRVPVLGDADLLHQAVANVLANAIAHTPSGTPIELTLERAAGKATLTVRDHGPGISDAERRQIFERFWRQSEARDRDSGGAGLGLAIVAGVVEVHGGAVGAENHPDGGAVFTLELPLEAAVRA